MTSSNIKLKRIRPLLGTFVEITLSGDVSEETLNTWITTGFEAIAEIDRLMSLYRSDSDLARLNQAKPEVWLKLHPHTIHVLRASNELFHASRGAFDIRCAKVSPSPTPPIEIRGTHVRKSGPWTFDLGGIAKGYAVDCGVQKTKQSSRGKLASGVVNAGGDLRQWGKETISVAVATSSVRTPDNSERLSPAAHVQMPGGKILKKAKTVTVISERCLWSDALTKVMLLAPANISERCLRLYKAQGLVLA